MTPLSRADGDIPREVLHEPSRPQEGHRNLECASASSSSVRWVSRLRCVACAPIVDRQTTFFGRAALDRLFDRRDHREEPRDSRATGRIRTAAE